MKVLCVIVLDRTKAQPLINPTTGEYNDPSAPSPVVSEYDPDPKGSAQCTVRDVSWNGNEPSMISTAWDSHSGGGNIAVHYWKGLGKGGLNRLEDWVEEAVANGGEGAGDDGRA
jgi:WD repeat-containing protein 23